MTLLEAVSILTVFAVLPTMLILRTPLKCHYKKALYTKLDFHKSLKKKLKISQKLL